VATEKGREIRELANWEISKLVWVVKKMEMFGGSSKKKRGWRFKLWQSV